MTQRIRKQQVVESGNEHELGQQDDFRWLADFREILSPYWSSRVEYNPEKKGHVLVLEGTETHAG